MSRTPSNKKHPKHIRRNTLEGFLSEFEEQRRHAEQASDTRPRSNSLIQVQGNTDHDVTPPQSPRTNPKSHTDPTRRGRTRTATISHRRSHTLGETNNSRSRTPPRNANVRRESLTKPITKASPSPKPGQGITAPTETKRTGGNIVIPIQRLPIRKRIGRIMDAPISTLAELLTLEKDRALQRHEIISNLSENIKLIKSIIEDKNKGTNLEDLKAKVSMRMHTIDELIRRTQAPQNGVMSPSLERLVGGWPEVTEMRKLLESLDVREVHLAKNFADQNKAILEKQLAETNSSITKMERELSEKRAQLNAITQQTNTIFQEEESKLKEFIDLRSQQLQEQRVKASNLLKERNEILTLHRKLSYSVDDEVIQSGLRALEEKLDKRDQLERVNAELTDQLTRLQNENEELLTRITANSSLLTRAEQTAVQTALQTQQEKLGVTTQILANTVQQSSSSVDDQQRVLDQKQALVAQISGVDQELERLRRELASKQENLQSVNDAIRGLEADYAQKEERERELYDRISKIEDSIRDKEQLLDSLPDITTVKSDINAQTLSLADIDKKLSRNAERRKVLNQALDGIDITDDSLNPNLHLSTTLQQLGIRAKTSLGQLNAIHELLTELNNDNIRLLHLRGEASPIISKNQAIQRDEQEKQQRLLLQELNHFQKKVYEPLLKKQADNERQRQQLEAQISNIEKHIKERDALRQQLSLQLKKQETDVKSIQDNINRNKQTLTTLQSEDQQTQEQIQGASNSLNATQKQLQVKQQELGRLRNELQAAEAHEQFQELRRKIEDSKKSLAALQAEFETKQGKVDSLNADIAILKRKEQDLTPKRDALLKTMLKMRFELYMNIVVLYRLRKQNKLKEDTIAQLQASATQLNQIQDKLTSGNKSLEVAAREFNELERALKEKNDSIARLKEQDKEQERNQTKLNAQYHANVESINSQIKQYGKDIAQLNEQLSALGEQARNLKKEHDRSLQNIIDQQTSLTEDYEQQQQRSASTISAAQAKVMASEQELARIQQNHSTNENEIRKAQENLQIRQDELARLVLLEASTKQEFEQRKQDFEARREFEIEELRKQQQQFETKKQTDKQRLDALQKEFNARQAEREEELQRIDLSSQDEFEQQRQELVRHKQQSEDEFSNQVKSIDESYLQKRSELAAEVELKRERLEAFRIELQEKLDAQRALTREANEDFERDALALTTLTQEIAKLKGEYSELDRIQKEIIEKIGSASTNIAEKNKELSEKSNRLSELNSELTDLDDKILQDDLLLLAFAERKVELEKEVEEAKKVHNRLNAVVAANARNKNQLVIYKRFGQLANDRIKRMQILIKGRYEQLQHDIMKNHQLARQHNRVKTYIDKLELQLSGMGSRLEELRTEHDKVQSNNNRLTAKVSQAKGDSDVLQKQLIQTTAKLHQASDDLGTAQRELQQTERLLHDILERIEHKKQEFERAKTDFSKYSRLTEKVGKRINERHHAYHEKDMQLRHKTKELQKKHFELSKVDEELRSLDEQLKSKEQYVARLKSQNQQISESQAQNIKDLFDKLKKTPFYNRFATKYQALLSEIREKLPKPKPISYTLPIAYTCLFTSSLIGLLMR